jgi:hypothetical protein
MEEKNMEITTGAENHKVEPDESITSDFLDNKELPKKESPILIQIKKIKDEIVDFLEEKDLLNKFEIFKIHIKDNLIYVITIFFLL